MSGIAIAAIITISLSLLPAVWFFIKRIQGLQRFVASASMLLSGAAFFGAYYLLRLPLDRLIRAALLDHPTAYLWITSFYAPLTEEPAKWLVLFFIIAVFKLKLENNGAWAVCLGIGFGIGEIIFLANNIAQSPFTFDAPWYYSSGFILERLMVCFIHSAFYLIAIKAICSKKSKLIWLTPTFHWLLNMPIFLSSQLHINDGGALWSQILWAWIILFFAASIVFLGKKSAAKVSGE